jgi:chemotaxis protein MotB
MSEPEEAHSEGAPEWMVSYADMITILMSFFVVMFSMAGSKNPKKEDPVMMSLRRQFGRFVGVPATTFLPNPSSLPQKNGQKPTAAVHDSKTAGLVGDHKHVATVRAGDQHALGGVLFFKGQAVELSADQHRELQEIGRQLAGKPQKIEVRGHTGNRAVQPDGLVGDNWDLAYQRCHAAAAYLVSLGISPARIRFGVSAQYDPAYTGLDPVEIQKNNRVEIFMLNEFTEDWHGDKASAGR